jgi:hypothetical protein
MPTVNSKTIVTTEKQKRDLLRRLYQEQGFLGNKEALEQLEGEWDKKDTEDWVNERYEELTDPDSELYQKFYSNTAKTLNETTPTIDSLLGLSMAMGGDYGGSSYMAGEQRKAIEQKNREKATNATEGFYLEAQGQANNVMGMDLQNKQYYAGLKQNQEQFEESQPSWWEGLLNIGGGLLGSYLGGLGKSNSGNSGATKIKPFKYTDFNNIMDMKYTDYGV